MLTFAPAIKTVAKHIYRTAGLRKREPRLYAFSCCEPLFVWMPDVAAAHALGS
jgi:hypothetical protein